MAQTFPKDIANPMEGTISYRWVPLHPTKVHLEIGTRLVGIASLSTPIWEWYSSLIHVKPCERHKSLAELTSDVEKELGITPAAKVPDQTAASTEWLHPAVVRKGAVSVSEWVRWYLQRRYGDAINIRPLPHADAETMAVSIYHAMDKVARPAGSAARATNTEAWVGLHIPPVKVTAEVSVETLASQMGVSTGQILHHVAQAIATQRHHDNGKA